MHYTQNNSLVSPNPHPSRYCAPNRTQTQGNTICDSLSPVKLTPREQQAAALLLQGCTNLEIAEEMKIKSGTVKLYLKRIFLKFGIVDGYKRVKLAVILHKLQEEK